MIKILSQSWDNVIKSDFLIAETTYGFAIKKLYPLISRLDIQRRIQSENFYKRLEIDLLEGCIMPPITVAFISDAGAAESPRHESFINAHVGEGFILDGIQRLHTLHRVFSEVGFDCSRPLFLNIIICPSRDNLLYRMVTLNNGQKPMSVRHQIEMLAADIYDFGSLGINIEAEKAEMKNRVKKEKKKPSFKKADVISSYIGFLSNSVSIENTKIIQEKMDELIARQIMDSNITQGQVQFEDVIKAVARFSKIKSNFEWFKNLNNLIGFCVGCRTSLSTLEGCSAYEFQAAIARFEDAFSGYDVSKIKLSRERRSLSKYFIENFNRLSDLDSDSILMAFSEIS